MGLQWNKPTVEEAMQLGYEAFEPEITKRQDPSQLAVAAATLRIENPLSSWVEGLNFQSEEEDVEGYDLFDDLPDKFLPYSEAFEGVRSPDQSLVKQAQIERQIGDRETMARGGGSTIGWSLVAGLGDPVNLPLMILPGGIALKGGATAGKVAAVTAIGGMAEAGVSEAALHATQPTRTWQETLFAVGGTALLGGALGGLAGVGAKRTNKLLADADREIADIVENDGLIDIDSVGTAGAQRVVGTLEEEGSEMLGPGINPLVRLLKSESVTARATTNKMIAHNFYLGADATQVRQADGTLKTVNRGQRIAVETEVTRLQQGMSGKYLRNLNTNYKAMRKAGKTKIRKNQFKSEVGRAMRNNDEHAIPEVALTAKQIRRDVIDPIKRGFQEIGDLPADVKAKYAASYYPRVYDTGVIRKNQARWLEMLTRHFTGRETSALEARALAEDITDKILASPSGRMPMDIVGSTGRIKERVLDIRDEVLQAEGFLIDDIDDVLQKYLRSTVPELELKRAFGDHEMLGEIQGVKDEYAILVDAAKDDKTRKALRKRMERDVKDVVAIRDLMLGRNIPSNDYAKSLTNVAKVARQLSFMANLGMVMLSSVPDIFRPIMQHGVQAWAKALPRAMLYWGKQTKLARRDLEDMAMGVDSLLSSRVYQLAEIYDIGNAMEKFTRTFAKRTGVNLWTATMKKVAAFTAQNRFIDDSRKYVKLSARRKERLAKAGIDERMAKAIAEQSDEFGEKLGPSWHANTNDWTDREAANLFERVLLRDVDNTIVTPGVADRPLFMSTVAGQTILQFRSFFFAAHNQVMIPMLQQMARGDAAAFEGLVVGMSLGMMGEWIRLNIAGRGDELADYTMQDWVRAGLDRSGIAPIPMELFNMTDRLLEGKISQQMNLTEGSRYFYRDWFGTLAGAPINYVANAGGVVQNLLNSDGITESDIHSIRRLMPYQNVFYLRKGIDEMEKNAAKATGAKPRRKRRKRSKSKGTFFK